jgi:mRNA interferase MazF
MELKRGDIVLIVVPGDLGKPRPAVVVQANDLGKRRTFVVCPMSSDVAEAPTLRPIVEPSDENGLRAPSQVMTELITAVRSERVRRVIGRLGSEDQASLDRALLIVLDLSR